MRNKLSLFAILAAILGVGIYFAFRSGQPEVAEVGAADVKPRVLSVSEKASLGDEAGVIESRLDRELERRLAGVNDAQDRQAVALQFHADFADDLARSQEIEDALVNANSDLLKDDKVFLEEKRRIRTVADFIRAGHSVEEAERMAKEEKS
jgi:hypothetical protein